MSASQEVSTPPLQGSLELCQVILEPPSYCGNTDTSLPLRPVSLTTATPPGAGHSVLIQNLTGPGTSSSHIGAKSSTRLKALLEFRGLVLQQQ